MHFQSDGTKTFFKLFQPTLYNVGPIEVINNPSKYIITRTDIGKYKCVILEPNGDGIIWDMEFYKETLCMVRKKMKK